MVCAHRITRNLAAGICALLLAGSLAVAGTGIDVSPAFADEPAAGSTEKIDINSLKSFEVKGDQYNLSPANSDGSITSAMIYSYQVGKPKNDNVLKEGTDYTVTYDWSGVNKQTGTGTVTATITGIGKYTGTVTYKYNIVEYVAEVSGVTADVQSFNQTQILKWMADATDNTEDQFYQYGTTVVMVPAKSYLTIDTFLANAGLPADKANAWKSVKATAPDGFGTSYPAATRNNYWFPAQTATGYDAAGAKQVPLVFTFHYLTASIDGTSGATALKLQAAYKSGQAAITAMKADNAYVPRTFVGASQTDYADGDNMGGNRFPTGVTSIALSGLMPSENLTDVPDNWAKPYIDAACNKGLMAGYAGTTKFGPNDTLTRAQAITILYRASVTDSSDTSDPAKYATNNTQLADNLSGKFYTAAINWAVQQGIVDQARPNDTITRQELATMIGRYANTILGKDVAAAPGTAAESCTDWAKVASWAQQSIKWTAANDILSGVVNANGTKTIDPTGKTTRAQMAKIIVNTLALA